MTVATLPRRSRYRLPPTSPATPSAAGTPLELALTSRARSWTQLEKLFGVAYTLKLRGAGLALSQPTRRVLLGRRPRYGLVVFSIRQAMAMVSVSGRFAFGWMPYISLTRSLARDTSHRIDDLSTRFEGEIAGTAHATTNGSSLVLSRSASVAGSEPPSFRKASGGSPAARAAYAWAEWSSPRDHP